MTTLHQAILNGPNRFSRILGHGTINGVESRLRIRVNGFSHAVVEHTDATRENDTWHMFGGNYSLLMPFRAFLGMIPCVAQFRLTPALAGESEAN